MGSASRLLWLAFVFQAGISLPASAQQAPVPSPQFNISRFEVSGNTILPEEDIDHAVSPYAGRQREFSDIQRALEALEQAYRDRGYGVVQVLLPEQDITQGAVRFRVVQRRVGRVSIEGNKHFDTGNIRRSLPAVKEGEIPSAQDIARNLQMLGEHPVKQTNVVLRSGASESEVDVGVRVTDDKPWRVIFTLDNTGTAETGGGLYVLVKDGIIVLVQGQQILEVARGESAYAGFAPGELYRLPAPPPVLQFYEGQLPPLTLPGGLICTF